MNAYQTAQAMGLTGTDAEIVAILQTITSGPIDPARVRQWSREQGLWFRKPDSTMGGTLSVAYPTATPQQQAALDQFFAAIWGDSLQTLNTTQPPASVTVWGIVQTIAGLNPTAAGLVDSFYALDGGRPFKDTTEAQYAGQKADAIRQQSADAVFAEAMNQIVNPAAADPARTEASIRAAFTAAAAAVQVTL